jgi:PPOX class probable F420-dependent enzyme
MSNRDFTQSELNFLNKARVGRLATCDAAGQPHVVPVVFATDGQALYTPLDQKPKRVTPGGLKRVRNLLANPRVALVVDAYHEDWTQLEWVLVQGAGNLVDEGDAHTTGVGLLLAKYPQYQQLPLNDCPLIVITPAHITSWAARQAGGGPAAE